MKLTELLSGICSVDKDIEVGGLCLDSRQLRQGDAFLAVNGALQHGMAYARQALTEGAVALIYDPEGVDASVLTACSAVPTVAVVNLSEHLGDIAARFYSHPSRKIEVIGITGTNGKTTCSQLLAQALVDCGVIGTLGWGKPGRLFTTVNTTPDALAVQNMLHALAEQGLRNVAMEVSSHGLAQGRVNAVEFKGAVFTNLSRDHLDYHGDMQSYLQAKLGLFAWPSLRFAVVNLDDANSGAVLAALDKSVAAWTFSVEGRQVDRLNNVTVSQVDYRADGIRFRVHWGEQSLTAFSPVVGAFNLQNVLTVLCVLLALDWPFDKAVARLAELRAVVGRMESFGGSGKPSVIVDYAHTPDALEKVLQAARGAGRLWVVFGCGGDRDKGKRPQMGRIAEIYADRVIVTDDNPRSEAPESIINDILSGCQSERVSIIQDRQTAISTAIQQASSDDCIVIAGKGHESYQEVNGVKTAFSDQAVVRQALALWSAAA